MEISYDIMEDIIGEELQLFRDKMYAMLYASIQQHNYTGESLKALKIEIIKASADYAYRFRLYIKGQASATQMSRRYAHNAPDTKLMEWVRHIGVGNFETHGGAGKRFPTEDEAVKRIAWGIIKTRQQLKQKSNIRKNAFPFLYYPFYSEYASFRDRIREQYAITLTRNIKKILVTE